MNTHLVVYAEQSCQEVVTVCGEVISTWGEPVAKKLYTFERAETKCPECIKRMSGIRTGAST